MSDQKYEKKFKEFIGMLDDAKSSDVRIILIHHPEVLGDNYVEVIESLNRLSAARLTLHIISPAERSLGNNEKNPRTP